MLLSAIHLNIVLDALSSAGYARESWRGGERLPGPERLAADAWIAQTRFEECVQVALDTTGDPGFGFVVGSSLVMARYGPMAGLAMTAPDLRSAVDDLRRFANMTLSRPELDLHRQGDWVIATLSPILERPSTSRFRIDQVMTSLVMMLRIYGAEDGVHLRVELPYPQPAELGRCRQHLGAALSFRCDAARLWFHADLLPRSSPLADHHMNAVWRARAEADLAAREQRTDVLVRVRQRLMRMPPHAAQAATIARDMGLSERTLRRHLQAVGTCWGELVEDSLRLRAESLLLAGELPLKRIADKLGYADSSSFVRAFRRWTGLSPIAWQRRELGASAPPPPTADISPPHTPEHLKHHDRA